MAELTSEQQRDFEAAAFRTLVEHLRNRADVQNIDLMNLAGFCRNCLSNWYRDAAKAEGIEGPVAPYFIDAAGMSDGGYPVAGLTVVSFRNTHLVYAITWFALAAMVVAGLAILWRHERKLRRGAS